MATSSFFDHSTAPTGLITASDGPYVLGTVFYTTADGQITSIWFYASAGTPTTGTVAIYPGVPSGQSVSPLLTQSFTPQTTAGWQEIVLDTPLDVVAGSTTSNRYIAAVVTDNVNYISIDHYFNNEVDSGELAGVVSASIGNGRFAAGSTLVTPSSGSPTSANYGVDVTFVSGGGGGGGWEFYTDGERC
jgi:hypothetical protein